MANHETHHLGRSPLRERLKVMKSPIVRSKHNDPKDPKAETENAAAYSDYSEAIPDFHRHEEPTLLEIFYDLFFAANYNVYSENQDATNHSRFKASIGYFCLLWITWFVTTAYDVRYVTDSIFERTARALQLGVLVGFVVVAPNFDPDNQDLQTMRTMSLILMFSRLFLVMEYLSTLWHARKYKKSRFPLYLQIALNFVAAMIYLGITFRFTEDKNSRVFMTWYFVSGAEGILTLVISYFWSILSFSKTHLMKRLSLLTVMLIGDGLVNIAKEVVTIVKQPDAWDGLTIGQITAGVATAYFVFLIYFDWLRSSFYLPKLRQLIWAFLHFPFHLALVLFIQAFTQFIIWTKVISVYKSYTDAINYNDDDFSGDVADIRSENIAAGFNESTTSFLKIYPPKNDGVQFVINAALKNISNIPNDFWPALFRLEDADPELEDLPANVQQGLETFIFAVRDIITSMTNNLFQAFGIDLTAKVETKLDTKNVTSGAFQSQLNDKTFERYRLVFAYGYISAGCTLAFMTLLTIVARTTKWKPWPIVRVVVVFLLSIGTSLVALLWYAPRDTGDFTTDPDDICYQFLESPWVLPTITLVYTVVLVITHLGGTAASDAMKRTATFLSSSSSGKQSQKGQSMPMTTWKNDDRKEVEDATYDRLDGPSSPGLERQRSDDIGVAYGGDSDRPHTGYDPLKQDTAYKGAGSSQV